MESATEYCNGELCLRVSWLIGEGVVTKSNYDNLIRRGRLRVVRRGGNGRTALVSYGSLPDRLKALVPVSSSGTRLEPDAEARRYYGSYVFAGGERLPDAKVREYTYRASAFGELARSLERCAEARARCNGRFRKQDFWAEALAWHSRCALEYGFPGFSSARTLERAFNRYLKDGYASIVHRSFGNDSARLVSVRTENLLLSLWRMRGKPFAGEVHRLYLEFASGGVELFDRSTGEVFRPEDFRYGDPPRPLEISRSTVWNVLKDVSNETAVYADRNGNFDYVNTLRPKHRRKPGVYSLSKISMDDVALSRKSVRGWVYRYIAVDTVSGYWFRPAYTVGKPTLGTVTEAFRNMFCELVSLGLPMPAELEVEYHLMKDIGWLNEVFPFVRFCESPTEKRAEHAIRSLKYGASKRAGHTRGRWYAKHEAYRSVRNRVDGDFAEPEYQPQTIVADDLADIDRHNGELHPRQKQYPGMTRRDVFLKNVNPGLKPVEMWRLMKYIGNETETSIRNSDWCAVANGEFEIDFGVLDRLKPNSREVTAYWLPGESGEVDRVYLYQDGAYVGDAVNRARFAYCENAVERTAADEAGMLHQQKRLARFDRLVKAKRADIPATGIADSGMPAAPAGIEVETVPNAPEPEPVADFGLEYAGDDFAEMGRRML
jgi:hypothetical protein